MLRSATNSIVAHREVRTYSRVHFSRKRGWGHDAKVPTTPRIPTNRHHLRSEMHQDTSAPIGEHVEVVTTIILDCLVAFQPP